MNKSTITLIFAALLAMVGGIWLGSNTNQNKQNQQPPEIQGVILPAAKVLDNFNLSDHHGGKFSRENLKQQWSIIFMGYTQCPDVCPTTLSTLKQVNELMAEQQIAAPRMIFISVDPERDSIDMLKSYVTYFNPDYIGATGSRAELDALAKQLGVFYAKAPGTSGDINRDDYLIDHSSSLMLINPDGALQAYLTAPHTPMQIIDGIIRTQVYYQDGQ